MKKLLTIFCVLFPLFAFGASHDLNLTIINQGNTNFNSLGLYRSGSQPGGSTFNMSQSFAFSPIFNGGSGINVVPGQTYTMLIPDEGFYPTDGFLPDDLTYSAMVGNGTQMTNSVWTVVDGGYNSYTAPQVETVTLIVTPGGFLLFPCYTSVTYNPVNSSIAYQTYYAVDLTIGARSALVTIPPGGSAPVVLDGIPCMDTNQTFLVEQVGATPSDNDNIVYGVPPAFASVPTLGNVSSNDFVANIPSPNQAPAAVPTTPYNPTNAFNTGSNAPIVYTQSASTNAILSQQQGNDALYTSLAAFAKQNHLDLQKIDTDINSQSNSFDVAGITNQFGVAQTNFEQFTDSLASTSWTNGSVAAVANYRASFLGLYGNVPTLPNPSGGDGAVEIPVATQVPTIKIDTTKITNLAQIRPLIIVLASAIIWTRLLVTLLGITNKSAMRILQARQVQGNKQQASFLGFGGNADIPTALVYSGVITAIVFAFPTLLVAVFTTVHTGSDGVGGALSNAIAGVGPLWNVMTTFVPIGVFLTAFTTWAVFKYLLCDIFVGAGMIIILFLFS